MMDIFLQCGDHSQTGFWDNKQYLLDPVCVFIVFVNSVLRPFLNVLGIFAPASEKTAGIVLCCFLLFCFFVILFHTFQNMALWTTGTIQNDLTCV